MIAFGLNYVGWLRFGHSTGASGTWNRVVGRALDRQGIGSLLALGALNGLLPCGMVYGALSISVSAGNALGGGLAMLLFGLGTVPALLVLGLGARAVPHSVRVTLSRVGFVLVVVVGLQLALRGLATLGLISHLRLGHVMLW